MCDRLAVGIEKRVAKLRVSEKTAVAINRMRILSIFRFGEDCICRCVASPKVVEIVSCVELVSSDRDVTGGFSTFGTSYRVRSVLWLLIGACNLHWKLCAAAVIFLQKRI